MEKTKISIIGFGNFGKFAAKHLSKLNELEVYVTDFVNKEKEAEELGLKFVSLEKALENKVIIIAVPMENFESTIINISDKILSGSLVLDVCSLKIFSCDLMEKYLSKDIEIIGTHPLFGPQSASSSINGMKIVLCNINANNESISAVKNICETLGLEVIFATPEEHDKQMASSQALVHFICQAINQTGLKRVDMSTKTFNDLMNIADIVKNDTPALFNNIETMNPFAQELRDKFISEAVKINEDLKNKK